MAPGRSGAEADARLVGVDAHVGDLAEVEPHDAVLERELVPAALARERAVEPLERVGRDAQRAAPGRRRSRSRSSGGGASLMRSATISVSTPPVARGWMNAMRESRMPVRGCSSISSTSRSRELRERGVDVGDAVGDVVQARAARGEEAADGGVRRERREQLDVALGRSRAAPPRRPARRSPRGARAPSRSARRRSRARRRARRRRSPRWSMPSNMPAEV